jgi:class 3 adenylate cyclase/tetratricopeptide (TPR) repeat protein
MRCPTCAAESPDGADSCAACGTRLAPLCRRCGTALRPAARFCDACGEPVAAAPDAPPPGAYTPRHLAEKILTSRSAMQGERKQVTVLFADVKGSMDLAEQVDPEDWHRVMDRFFGILADGVHRYEGTINQFTGDGIMALFGAPIAHEDHARRACHAALHLADALREYADELRRTRGLSFAVRMGLNSGEVVVGAIGDDLRMDYTAQGHTVGLAARIEQLAEPGKVYVTEHTAALVDGYVRLRELGPFSLKGVRQPVRVFALEGIGPLRTRLDVSRTRGFSRFVGREAETKVLDDALADAARGAGRLVGVVAEPGVGKSRLCAEFVERCAARGISVHAAQAVPYGRTVPFHVALELVRGWFGITPADGARAARKKIAGTLVLVDEELRDALPLVWDFLGVGDAERPAPRLDPDVRLRRVVAVLQRVLRAQSRHEPVVLLVEDLHWIDGGSDGVLAGLLAAVPESRTLALLNFRPEYRAPWMDGPHYRTVSLRPLGPDATTALLDELVGHDPSVAPLAARIAAHTGGNPFFVEELVRALVEGGTLAGARGAYRLAGPGDVTIPPSVQAVLAARIDRLGEREKLVLQTAAVIGKLVPTAILTRVAELAAPELDVALDALVASAFLYADGADSYAFAHPLTQEVAYRTQLAERRAHVHAAVARAITSGDADRLDERAALLAHHWERAGEPLEAARWCKRAAEWVSASDFPEARRHWQQMRTLLEALPETDEVLALRVTALGGILTCNARLGVDEAENAALFAELDALTVRIADPAARVTALAGPAAMRVVTGYPEAAIGPLLEAARLAVHTDLGTRVAVQAMLLLAYFVAGRFREADTTADVILEAAADDVQLGAQNFGLSPYLVALTFRGAIYRIFGRLDEAVRSLERGLALAHAHGQLEIAGYAHQGFAYVAYVRGDADAVAAHGQAALRLAERIDSPFSRTQAYEVLGAAHLFAHRWPEARASFEQAIAIMRDRRTGLNDEAFYLAGLARAHLGAGDLAVARTIAEEAVAVSRRRQTRYAACEANLALAEILTADTDPASWIRADAVLADALAAAVELGAVTTEPFVHTALAAVARRRGDEPTATRELDVAEQQFLAFGATRRAAEVAARR